MAAALILLTTAPAAADLPDGMVQAITSEIVVNADTTYVETRTFEAKLVNDRLVAEAATTSFDFDPTDEKLELLEAWITHADGTRIEVPAASIFTRPSAAAQSTPGFVDTQTTTVVFPQVQRGSVVHSKWRHSINTPQLLGFNANFLPELNGRMAVDVTITAPASLPIAFGQRGGFAVSDTTTGATRTITASIRTGETYPAEPHMVSPIDVGPGFVASTLTGYEQFGAIYARQAAGKAAVTPEIQTLAASIANGATGLEAARRVHNWVAGHIRYVAVYLSAGDDYVPHDAASVLRNGYGDCKDHVVLVQALLAALGVRAEAALVNWDNRMQPLPSWSSGSFNHVVAYLPDFDTYTNTTDPFAAFGVLDMMLSDKLVVIATTTGEVRHTPASKPQDNLYRFEGDISVDAAGTITGKSRIAASSRTDVPIRRMIAQVGVPAALGQELLAPTQEGGYGTLRSTDPRNLAEPLRAQGEWTSPHGVVVSTPSTYMAVPFGINPQPTGSMRGYISPDGERRFPLMMGAADFGWTYRITPPNGATITRLPPPVNIANAAGRFTANYQADGEQVAVTWRLVLDRDIYAATDYPALEALLYAQLDAQRSILVYNPAP
ncbi:DUF3857 domain-containing protein [Bosea sp. 117]|uniref:DUF3857 domain-containing protein n=1 Tax=Bosea sp. 117 TaxID=1125973 RepID=UPI000493E4E9|nr:DUF3857 domain-containing protein [Bosea sp. 117]